MALSLRFAEEAEFSSRACAPSYDDEPELTPPRAFFRWSRAAQRVVGGADTRLAVQTLVVATPNAAAQRFLRGLTQHWQPIATLVVSDQRVPSVSLDDLVAATELRSPVAPHDRAFGRHVAVIVPTELSNQSIWTWTQTLLDRVDAQEIVVLESQLSTIYSAADDYDDDNETPSLRVLTTSAARDEKLARLLPTLETPRFLVGVAAALLTQGELRQRAVRAFISLYSGNTPLSMATRSFARLLSLLDLPATSSVASPASPDDDEFHALYT